MSTPTKKYTYDAEVMQSDVTRNAANEPAFRTKIIDKLNTQCAESRQDMYLRLRQPNPIGHYIVVPYAWLKEEAESYLAGADRGALPRDLATLELDPVPDLKKHPAVCAFDMDGQGNIALIPSEAQEMKSTGPKKVLFSLKKDGGSAGR